MASGYLIQTASARTAPSPWHRPAVLLLAMVAWLLAAFASLPARADDQPSPEAKTLAHELVETIRLADQFKALLPAVLASLKPSIVQGRPEVARDYDAIVPVLSKGFEARLGELIDAVTLIYAKNFTPDEMRSLLAFYRTPTGTKLLDKTPSLTQQTMAAGQAFGRSVGSDLQKQIIEELRKKGHNI
ncbi:DUF2059 domain-containing protein [Rhodopseudomonas sp. HC1]|uniref:DUF2059 domain-containing protein n=1 Tax=Rhodopseudomonas infernalis TaxID=2897386 RepID=UPI001EE99B06|nr:DUF2059 domain-containing protein [Rhodopseudomonas infernalis]MCG6206200.1 DUF2059 domain-containing protein [Rhodopseudomonas infernalis]